MSSNITPRAFLIFLSAHLTGCGLVMSNNLKSIKPKTESRAKGVWVCRICGYVYEGEKLPDDFICPICKHGADDFEWREATITPTKTITPAQPSQKKEKYYKLRKKCPTLTNILEIKMFGKKIECVINCYR